MMPAYDKVYLEKARTALARMLDFAVWEMNYDISDFWELFLASDVAGRFETGDFTVLVGMSGVELAWEVLEQAGISYERVSPAYPTNRSEEYWTGWALAYYQWIRSLSFSNITKYIPIREIRALYMPYHEMDIRHFVERMDELYISAKPETNLKLIRGRCGFSQHELAKESGVPLRTIQQYEQRQKDINKARTGTLATLARVLYCNIEDLLEPDFAAEFAFDQEKDMLSQ